MEWILSQIVMRKERKECAQMDLDERIGISLLSVQWNYLFTIVATVEMLASGKVWLEFVIQSEQYLSIK